MAELSSVHHLLVSSVNNSNRCDRSLREVITNNDLNWVKAIETARYHGIIPLFYYRLLKENLTSLIPQDIVEVLRRDYYSNVFSSIKTYDALQNPLRIFCDSNIEVIVLKGAALAETLYPEIA